MNLYDELEKLLMKAKETNEYFNPNTLTQLYELCVDHDLIDHKEFDKDWVLSDWISNMWSR